MGKLSPIGDIKSPVGDNIANWGLGIYESSQQSTIGQNITNWGFEIPDWVLSSVSTLLLN